MPPNLQRVIQCWPSEAAPTAEMGVLDRHATTSEASIKLWPCVVPSQVQIRCMPPCDSPGLVAPIELVPDRRRCSGWPSFGPTDARNPRNVYLVEAQRLRTGRCDWTAGSLRTGEHCSCHTRVVLPV